MSTLCPIGLSSSEAGAVVRSPRGGRNGKERGWNQMPESRDRTNEGWPAANLRDLASKSQTITDGETLDGIWASEAFGQTTKSPSNRHRTAPQLSTT